MILVLDASAAVKLVLDEIGSDQVRRLWDENLAIVAPSILGAEVAAAIRAAGRDGRVTGADTDAAQRSWTSLLDDIDLLAVDADLVERARKLAATRSVRGMDAVYLAAALRLGEAGVVGLLSFDVRQRDAVHLDDGVHLLPAAVAPSIAT